MLPRVFVPATGHEAQLLVRELPFDMGALQVTMMWHMRRDAEPAQQWLRALVQRRRGRSDPGAPPLQAPGNCPPVCA